VGKIVRNEREEENRVGKRAGREVFIGKDTIGRFWERWRIGSGYESISSFFPLGVYTDTTHYKWYKCIWVEGREKLIFT